MSGHEFYAVPDPGDGPDDTVNGLTEEQWAELTRPSQMPKFIVEGESHDRDGYRDDVFYAGNSLLAAWLAYRAARRNRLVVTIQRYPR